MNTEPIGFKGSKEWILENIGSDSYFPSLHFRKKKSDDDHHGYIVLNASHNQEKESLLANALLIGAAKKMAVALQNLISLNSHENRQATNDILIEAGLY